MTVIVTPRRGSNRSQTLSARGNARKNVAPNASSFKSRFVRIRRSTRSSDLMMISLSVIGRIGSFLTLIFGNAYHTLGRDIREGGIRSHPSQNFINHLFSRCLEKKTGAGGRPAPLLTENLQGESMSLNQVAILRPRLCDPLVNVCRPQKCVSVLSSFSCRNVP